MDAVLLKVSFPFLSRPSLLLLYLPQLTRSFSPLPLPLFPPSLTKSTSFWKRSGDSEIRLTGSTPPGRRDPFFTSVILSLWALSSKRVCRVLLLHLLAPDRRMYCLYLSICSYIHEYCIFSNLYRCCTLYLICIPLEILLCPSNLVALGKAVHLES